jgi:molybdate transport system permease protein
MDWTALWVTLRLAVWTTLILLLLGLPLAYWLVTTRWRGRAVVEALVTLPLVLPPTVLGFYVLLATGPRSGLGRAVEAVTGRTIPFTFTGIVIASVLFNLPFAVRPFAAALAGVSPRLIEASWCLGVSKVGTFMRVMLPLAWPGVLAGMVLTFAHAMGEFGVVLMVGGAIPGVTKTISIAIYDDVQAMDYAAAGRASAVLVGIAFLALLVVHLLQRRG